MTGFQLFQLNAQCCLQVVTIILLFSCGGGSIESANTPNPQPSIPEEQQPESLQAILDEAALSVDSIIVYVEQRGQAPQQLSAGIMARNSNNQTAPQHLFKIASISKLYLAVAASKMFNESAFVATDTLAQWLPELSERIENSESITIRHLIEHRSGIPDFDSQSGFSWQDAHTDIDATLAFALGKSADFAPDARFEYSNTNYLLLARIMDKALGFSHQTYIQNNLLNPLSLNDTYLQYSEVFSERLISGYWQDIDRKIQDYVIPGGSMVATAQDVGIFIRALNTGELLNAEERALYYYWNNHSGWLPGYQSQAAYYADIDAVIVQFVSTTGGSSEAIANHTLSEILTFLRAQ